MEHSLFKLEDSTPQWRITVKPVRGEGTSGCAKVYGSVENALHSADEQPVADGGFEIWGGHDVMRGCICTAKLLVNLFFFFYK